MLHTGTHVPAGHVVDPFGFTQLVPHVPQFAVVYSDASQPSERASELQLPQLATHAIEQAPSAQLGVPWFVLHPWLHPPQFDTFVFRLISHPLLATPSQFAKPLLHDTIWQLPVAHEVVAFASAHAVPHPPQFVFVFSGVSQPFATLPSQLP